MQNQSSFHPDYQDLYRPLLKQQHVAARIGVSVTQLNQYLRGKRGLDPKAAHQLQKIHEEARRRLEGGGYE